MAAGAAADRERANVQAGERRGRILQWIHGKNHAPWGRDALEFDPEATKQTVDRAGRLFGPGRYFGLEIEGEGFANVPSGASMVVSNHSGGTTIPDVWGFLIAWYRHFGFTRPIHPMAHEIILSNRFTGVYFAKRGVLRGGRKIALRALREHRHDLMVMPGGDLDTWRPYSKRYEVRFSGRTGYARLAIKAGVPIVPVANAGAHETLIVLSDGRPFARAIGLHAIARAEIFPVHLSLPWGLAVGPWPHLPIPVTLRYRIGAPIMPPAHDDPEREPDPELVRALDAEVQGAVQKLLDELKPRT
jgi:1-acyl-sn-glycerol-3-phosphate acyltransferase